MDCETARCRDNAKFAERAQLWLRSQGQPIDVDGWAGTETCAAATRVLIDRPVDRQLSNPWPAPDERSLMDFYGHPGPAGLVEIRFPYPMRLAWNHSVVIHRSRCHHKVRESLESVLESILDLYGSVAEVRKNRMDLFAGIYNLRAQRGASAWSLHAWGAAIDLDSKRNGFRTPWPSVATMPVEVVEIFERHHWKSGARAWKRDAMHFQATQ